jgi:hypothetical protein
MLLYLGETCGNCRAYIKVTAFWDRAQCSLVEVDRRFWKIERRSTPNRLHGAISQKAVIFMPALAGAWNLV